MLVLTQQVHGFDEDHKDDVFLTVGGVEIMVRVISAKLGKVRIGYVAPEEVKILRRKVRERQQEA